MFTAKLCRSWIGAIQGRAMETQPSTKGSLGAPAKTKTNTSLLKKKIDQK
jgi:hypothetical protein